MISRIAVETLESLNTQFPEPTVHIEVIQEKYHALVAEKVNRSGHKKSNDGKGK